MTQVAGAETTAKTGQASLDESAMMTATLLLTLVKGLT